jgi:hypothetical protein
VDAKSNPPKGTLTKGGRIVLLILAGLAMVMVISIAILGLQGKIYFEPDWARDHGLLGPISEEIEEPKEMEGYIYRNFEVIAYGDCKYYGPGGGNFGSCWLGKAPSEVYEFIGESAKADGQNPDWGYTTIYIRAIGEVTWRNNIGFQEGFGSGGYYSCQVDILQVLDLQPMKDQCPK